MFNGIAPEVWKQLGDRVLPGRSFDALEEEQFLGRKLVRRISNLLKKLVEGSLGFLGRKFNLGSEGLELYGLNSKSRGEPIEESANWFVKQGEEGNRRNRPRERCRDFGKIFRRYQEQQNHLPHGLLSRSATRHNTGLGSNLRGKARSKSPASDALVMLLKFPTAS